MDEPGSSHKGKQINTYTAKFKLKVINYAKQHNNVQAAKTFGVDRKRVREWRKLEDKLEGLPKARRLNGAGRKVWYPDVEGELVQWVRRRREKGARVTGIGLKKECLRLQRLRGNMNFKASCGWLRKFMNRQNFSFRRATHVPQKRRNLKKI